MAINSLASLLTDKIVLKLADQLKDQSVKNVACELGRKNYTFSRAQWGALVKERYPNIARNADPTYVDFWVKTHTAILGNLQSTARPTEAASESAGEELPRTEAAAPEVQPIQEAKPASKGGGGSSGKRTTVEPAAEQTPPAAPKSPEAAPAVQTPQVPSKFTDRIRNYFKSPAKTNPAVTNVLAGESGSVKKSVGLVQSIRNRLFTQPVKQAVKQGVKKAAAGTVEQAAVKAGLGKTATKVAVWIGGKVGTKIGAALVPVIGWVAGILLIAKDIIGGLVGKFKGALKGMALSLGSKVNIAAIKAKGNLGSFLGSLAGSGYQGPQPIMGGLGARPEKSAKKIGVLALLFGGTAMTTAPLAIGFAAIIAVPILLVILVIALFSQIFQTPGGASTGTLFSVKKLVDKSVLPNSSGQSVVYSILVSAKNVSDLEITVSDNLTLENAAGSKTLSLSPTETFLTSLKKGEIKTISFLPFPVPSTSEYNDAVLVNIVTITAKSTADPTKTETLTSQANVVIGSPAYTATRCPLAPDTNDCAVSNLLPFFENDQVLAEKASRICYKESGGNASSVNDGCTKGFHREYSVAHFQIDLFAHDNLCSPSPFSKPLNLGPYPLSDACVRDEDLLKQCKDNLSIKENNFQAAYDIYKASGWAAWSAAAPQYCNIQ